MKYIYLFEEYNPSSGKGRSKTINESEFNDIINEKCKFYNKNKKVPLYRGLLNNVSPYLYVDPRGYTRHSIENENIHMY